jgi:hypothetical protein
LIDRSKGYVPLIQVYTQLELAEHYQSLQEPDNPVSTVAVQKRQPGLLKTNKYAVRRPGHPGDHLQIVRRLARKVSDARRNWP